MSIIKATIPNIVIKSGTGKTGNPYYFVEVTEPVRKFISAESVQVEMMLSELAKQGRPVNIQLAFANDRLVAQSDFVLKQA